VLAALALLALAFLLVPRSGEHGIEIEARDPLLGVDEIRVEVHGAVASPGVVAVPPGGRVADALALAGGLTGEGDAAALNLSRRVVDEERIVVPTRGSAAALLDVNRASGDELDALPGIGPAYSAAILEARAAAPFATTDDLVERGVIPERVYEGIRDQIAVY
jgi:competence protein ComEA